MDDFQKRRRGVRALRGETAHLHKKTFLERNGICVDKEGKSLNRHTVPEARPQPERWRPTHLD